MFELKRREQDELKIFKYGSNWLCIKKYHTENKYGNCSLALTEQVN